MEIKEETRGAVKIVGLLGRLDANSSPAVEKQIHELLEKGEQRLVLDLSKLTYISSLGLRIFISVAKTIRNANGRLALTGLSDHIYEIFKIAHFVSIFSIFPTLDEAVVYCSN